mgnify:FL=1
MTIDSLQITSAFTHQRITNTFHQALDRLYPLATVRGLIPLTALIILAICVFIFTLGLEAQTQNQTKLWHHDIKFPSL